MTTTYDYFARDINGTIIARENIDLDTLRRHNANLVVSGYRVQARVHGQGTVWMDPKVFGL